MKEALFLADPDTRINQQIALGLAEELQKEGEWNIRIEPSGTTTRQLREQLCRFKVDALVMHTAPFSSPMTEIVEDLPIPRICVAADWQPELSVPVVIADDEAIGRLAASCLMGHGFDHFAALYYKRARPFVRIQVFRSEILRAGKTFDSFLLPLTETVNRTFSAIGKQGQLVHWLRCLPKPCAILAHSDNPGAQLVRLCGRHGVRVPEDVAVLGVDDDHMYCRTVSPNLASIHVPNTRMGAEAARLILDWRPGRRVLKIPPTAVMERDSIRHQVEPDPLVQMAVDHIQTHVGEVVRVRDLQRLTGLTPQMLVYRFKVSIRRSPMEEILRHRINHAKYLLAETAAPAGTVARQCGFNSTNRFYLTFRNLAGMAPLDYRRQFSV